MSIQDTDQKTEQPDDKPETPAAGVFGDRGAEGLRSRDRVVRTADNEDLGPIRAGNFVIGYIREVNGPGAEELHGFVPTQHEVEVLARHYVEDVVRMRVNFEVYGQTGSWEIRAKPYALRRLKRIDGVLGEAAVDELFEREYAKFPKSRIEAAREQYERSLAEDRDAREQQDETPEA